MPETPHTINYFAVDELIKVHDYAIEHSGGLMGVKDLGLLESTLHHIQNDMYYPTFLDKLTHLTYSIVKNHCFNDGNKRTAISTAISFIESNEGFVKNDFPKDEFLRALEYVIIFVAESTVSKDDFQKILDFLTTENANDLWGFTIITQSLDENNQNIPQAEIKEQLLNAIHNKELRDNAVALYDEING